MSQKRLCLNISSVDYVADNGYWSNNWQPTLVSYSNTFSYILLYSNYISFNYPVRLHTRGRVITLSVHPWICLSVCLFVYPKMSTVSEVGKHAMCSYHVRGRNEKIVAIASTYLTSESIL